MVFLIQHSENKNSKALQLKLDELIAATKAASNRLLVLEDLDDQELEAVHARFERLARETDPFADDPATPSGDGARSGRSARARRRAHPASR